MFRMALDYGPLIAFFIVNSFAPGPAIARIMAATMAFMVAMLAAVAVSWWKLKHVSPMLWVSAALVLVFGGLTIYFHDERFIQVKPTIVYAMFAAVLGFGLLTDRPLLQGLLGAVYPGLTATGWRKLTINWTGFFIVMAVLNEAMRATLTWDQWVAFKTWGVIPLSLLFALANVPMLMRHGLTLGEDAPEPRGE
jgi:intracellular septation protein